MTARRRGDVVFVTSDVVERPRPSMVAYVTSKWGLEGYVRSLQMELEGTGVRATIVRPGPTLTGMGMDWDPDVTAEVIGQWARLGLRPPLELHAPGAAWPRPSRAVVALPRGTHATVGGAAAGSTDPTGGRGRTMTHHVEMPGAAPGVRRRSSPTAISTSSGTTPSPCSTGYGPSAAMSASSGWPTRDVVLLSGAEANELFFRAPEEVLDQAEAYPFMTPIFGEGVVFDAPPERRREMLHNQALRDKFMRGHAATIADEVEAMVAGWGATRGRSTSSTGSPS